MLEIFKRCCQPVILATTSVERKIAANGGILAVLDCSSPKAPVGLFLHKARLEDGSSEKASGIQCSSCPQRCTASGAGEGTFGFLQSRRCLYGTADGGAADGKTKPPMSISALRKTLRAAGRERPGESKTESSLLPLSHRNVPNDDERLTAALKTSQSYGQIYDPPLRPSDPYPGYVQPFSIAGGWSDRWVPYHPLGAYSNLDVQHSPSVGYEVPYRFRVAELRPTEEDASKDDAGQRVEMPGRDYHDAYQYTDFAGNRFPTLDTAENYRYWKDTGLDRLLPRVFPISLPKHRKLDPVFREYIHFLHSLDPQRFTLSRIAERYSLKEATTEYAFRDASLKLWLDRTGLCQQRDRRISKNAATLEMKEYMYSLKLGYDQLGDEEIVDEPSEEFKGWKSTVDWVNRQSVQVEMMSAFPLPGKRNPMPKRVDVDLPVANTRDYKIINWIDPHEKVVF